jgi:hypothetical protein
MNSLLYTNRLDFGMWSVRFEDLAWWKVVIGRVEGGVIVKRKSDCWQPLSIRK